MNHKLENRFIVNYILMFVISTMIALFVFMLLGFAGDVISKTLVKNNYTAELLMEDDYSAIDVASVIKNGGGVQVVNKNYKIVFSTGINTFTKEQLTTAEFTDFLTSSKQIGIDYSFSTAYNSNEEFWLIVTFPTSVRIDFDIAHNKDYPSVDVQGVVGLIVAIVIFYLILIALSTVIYSKLTSLSIINPLRKLSKSARRLKDGEYSARVELNLKNEFGELGAVFDEMAQKIEQEMMLRIQSEDNRRKMVLDLSHDLKNPLASIMGYAEYCYNRSDLSRDEQANYMKIIYENSVKANHLLTDLFELSKMESSQYVLSKARVDICEYLRTQIGTFIATLDQAGFTYEFNIPESEIIIEIDAQQMDRVLQNLVDNSIRYNSKGTQIMINLVEKDDGVFIHFKDNGIGIPAEIAQDMFQPFVRVDRSRNSRTGGTGLGLAIVHKIISLHNGHISLQSDENVGCEFTIYLPKI